MWLVFALLSPVFWAIVHVLDSHCVERVFEKPWMGVITSSIASLIVILVIPFALPFTDLTLPEAKFTLLALLAGFLIQVSQVLYFQALDHSEAGIVAAYWNLTPALVPVASLIFFGKVLSRRHYLGIGLLVITSVCFCLIGTDIKTNWRAFWLMMIASCLQVNALLLEDQVFKQCTFFVGFLLITVGIIITGVLPLLFVKVRRVFSKNMVSLRPAIPMIFGIEVANLIALFMSQRAIDLGVPSLVAAVEATVPAYTFALSILLLTVYSPFGDQEAWNYFPFKLFLSVAMAFGVRLVI
jgi:drug/metabolite transporter (DMT)-like permease